MALKYSIEYPDVKDVVHRLEIYDDSYAGAEIEVEGAVFFDHAETDDPLECLRGQGLRVELEANSSLTFSDLYSEEQQTFQVIYKRNSVTLFNGWLNPNGWFESYVQDQWRVSFDCVDGLGFLSELSFVDNTTGAPFTDIKTQLEIIALALERTGIQQNINVDIQIYYTGLSATSILASVNARTKRYKEEDRETITSCEDVIRDVLEPYGACITSHEGEWFIYKPNQIFSSATLTYYRYDYQGTALSPATATKDISFSLGSEIDGFYPHHCSGNQQIRFANSIGAYRINYKYGDTQALLGNPFFEGTDPLDDWSTTSATNLTFDNPGVTFLGPTGTKTTIENLATEISGLAAGDVITWGYMLFCTLPPTAGFEMDWEIQIISTDASDGNLRYLSSNGKTWRTDSTAENIIHTYSGGGVAYSKQADPLPQAGKVKIKLLSASTYGGAPVAFDLEVSEFTVIATTDTEENIEGEFHDFQRTTKPAKEVKDIVEVLTGDSASDKYVGTLYKADTTTPTTTWYRTGITEEKGILQIMGEETLRLSASVSKVFRGDVFGYMPFLSRVIIDGFPGEVFMPIKWSYDTRSNIISAELRQIYGGELVDISYKTYFDYGETVKPTIVG